MSRRAFIQGASVAGAAALGGYASMARADAKEEAPDTRRPTCIAPLDKENIVTCDDEGNVKLWGITEDGVLKPGLSFKDHPIKATFVATANGMVLTSGYDGAVAVRSIATSEMQKFTKHRAKKEVWVVAAAPDGTVVSATNDGQILKWNVTQGNASQLTEYIDDDRDDPVGGLVFVPPEKDKPLTRFLSTHSHGDINLWTIEDRKNPKTFSHRNSHHVNAVAVTTDGKRFVSAGFDMTVRVWHVDDNRDRPQPIITLRGHRHLIWRVAISHDDSKVASASQDGTVRLWDIRDGLKDSQRPLGKPIQVGERGSMGVAFVKPKDKEFLVYTTNHLPDPNKPGNPDQVRVLQV